MTDDTDQNDDTPAARLAQALARRKAATGGGSGAPGASRASERAAAARAVAKSKPAMRK